MGVFDKKIKVAIVAYDYPSTQPAKNIIGNIRKYCSSQYSITIFGKENMKKVLNSSKFDVIYFYNVLDILNFNDTYDYILSGNYNNLCTTLQSWRSLLEDEKRKKLMNIGSKFKIISALNKAISDQIPLPDDQKMVTPCAGDQNQFKRQPPKNNNDKICFGYVGTFREDKNFKNVFVPAMNNVKNQLPNVEFLIAGRAGRSYKYNRMKKFYNNIDCLVCTSKWEGGPAPTLEAALCGKAIVTTKCGFMPEVFDEDSAIFINSDKQDLEKTILSLHQKGKTYLQEMGDRAHHRVNEHWRWEHIIPNYENMFHKVVSAS